MAEIFQNEVNVQDSDGNDVIRLNADLGNIAAGGFDKDGDLRLFDKETPIGDPADAIIVLDADNAQGRFGGNEKNGKIILRAADGNDAVTINGEHANVWLGGRGRDGDIHLMAASTNAHTDKSLASVSISGNSGDITLRNADCAEEFSVAVEAEPGTVMTLGADGLLRPSVRPYDKSAVGVVSGAGGYKPGIILDRKPEQRNRSPHVSHPADASHPNARTGHDLSRREHRGMKIG